MVDKGCGCKGSVGVHASCFQKWVKTAENPFQCPVCKTDYHSAFLSSFMTVEEMLLRGENKDDEVDEDDENVLFYQQHGVPIMECDGFIYFETDEHFSIYNHSYKMEKKSIRMDIQRKQNSMQNCMKGSKNYARGRGQVHRMRK